MSNDLQVQSLQFLTPTRFACSIRRLPNVEYNVNQFNLPGISIGQVPQPNIFNAQLIHPGEALVFEPLQFSFLIDEELNNYFEVVEWMVALGTPTEFSDYTKLFNQAQESGNGLLTDITMFTLSNSKNPINAVRFINAYPTSLTQIPMSTQDQSTDPMTADVTFVYERYERTKLPQTPDSK